MASIGVGAGTGALSGAVYGTLFPIPGVGTVVGGIIGAVLGAVLGAATAAIAYSLRKSDSPGGSRASDIITTSTTATTPVAVSFGRNRLGGNVIAVGAFYREPDPLKGTKNNIFRVNMILGLCEGGPPPLTQGFSGPHIIKQLKDGIIWYPFGNIRVDGQLPYDLAQRYGGISTGKYYQYKYYPGTNKQAIPDFVLDPRRGYNMLPHIPWRNTAVLECYLLADQVPRLVDVNIDHVGPDYTIRRNGTTTDTSTVDRAKYAFFDSRSDSFYYTVYSSTGLSHPWGLVGVGRQGSAPVHYQPPASVTDDIKFAWYLGHHDVLVMQDPNDSGTFYVGTCELDPSSDLWETQKPDRSYSDLPIKAFHLDETHGILHTIHAPSSGSGNAYIMRWWLLTGRVERTDTDISDHTLGGFIYSADLNCYAVMTSTGLALLDPRGGSTYKFTSAIQGGTGLCVSGTMVGTISASGIDYFDVVTNSTFGRWGSGATDTDAGHFGGLWTVHQNTYTGHVTISKMGDDGNIALINFIPSVVEDIRDLNANGTSNLGQDPLSTASISGGGNNGNPEPDFQLFPFDTVAGWIRDWSVRQTNAWYLNALEGTGSLAAALWASNVDEPNLDSKRWGAGLDPKYFDLGSFEGLHWYCVGGVKMPNADGSYRRAERYKFEMLLNTEMTAAQFSSDHVLLCCQGWRTIVSGVMHVGVTKPGQWPLWHFNDKDILPDPDLSLSFIGRSQGINRVRVEYRDILTEYRHNYAQAQYHWDIQRRRKVQQAVITAEGCGRYGSAYLLANAVLDQTRAGRRQTAHKCHVIGWMFTAADPVEISHMQSALSHMPARIVELREEGDVIEFTCLEQAGPRDASGGVGVGSYAPTVNDGSGVGNGFGVDIAQSSGPIDGSVSWVNAGASYPAGVYQITYLQGTYRPVTSTGTGGALLSTWNNCVAGYQIVTRDAMGATVILGNAPGLVVDSPGWPTPTDAEAANQDQTCQITTTSPCAIGIALPTGTQSLLGSGWSADDVPTTPTFSVVPIATMGVPSGYPDPSALPSTLLVVHTSSSAFNNMSCSQCPPATGTAWDGHLTLQPPNAYGSELDLFALYTFVSLDAGSKTVFGSQTGANQPPVGTPNLVYHTPPAGAKMWLLQCVLFWTTKLSSGGPGWTIQFYGGSTNVPPQNTHGNAPNGSPNPTATTGQLGEGVLVWEGELSDVTASAPAGTYIRSAASSSVLPASVVVS